MGAIPFPTIASSGLIRTNTNAIEYNAARAITGRSSRPHKILVMGQRLSTGTLAALTASRVYSPTEGDSKGGVGSMVAEMVRAAKACAPLADMWMMGIAENASGTVGTKTLTITVTTALQGTLHIYVAGEFYIPVPVSAGDAQNTIAANIVTAIQAHGQYARMPFTVAASTNVVTFTMKWKGVDVADVRINYNDSDVTPGGVTAAVAAGVSGAGNPDISTIITAIASDRYDTIIVPWSDSTNLGLLKTELDRRWNGQVKLWCHAFMSTTGNHGAAVTTGNAHNNPHLTFMPANTSPNPPWIWASVIGALEAKATMSHPAIPRQSIKCPILLPPARDQVWIESQRNTLLFSGAATYTVDDSRSINIERLTTTYKANAQGISDWTFLDVETPRTLAAIMYDLDSATSLRFPRCLLSDDVDIKDLPVGVPIVTPKSFKGFVLERWDLWAAAGWVEGGQAKRDTFKNELVVLRPDDSRTRLEADLGPDLMNQFRGLSAQVSFVL